MKNKKNSNMMVAHRFSFIAMEHGDYEVNTHIRVFVSNGIPLITTGGKYSLTIREVYINRKRCLYKMWKSLCWYYNEE